MLAKKYGLWQSVTMSGTTSVIVNLGGEWDYIQILFPTVSNGTFSLHVSDVAGGNYYAMGDSMTTETNTGNYADIWNVYGYQFIKIASSVSQSVTLKIRPCAIMDY